VIPGLYVLVRYFSYGILRIDSTYTARPLATLVWTAGMGCWVGVMYVLAGRYTGDRSPLARAAVFGGLLFGVNWLVFNLFALLFIKISVMDLVLRSVFDALAVAVGVYVLHLLSVKRAARAAEQ
jgi:hypothetical protein